MITKTPNSNPMSANTLFDLRSQAQYLQDRSPRLAIAIKHYLDLTPELPDRLNPPTPQPGDRYVTINQLTIEISGKPQKDDIDMACGLRRHIKTYFVPTQVIQSNTTPQFFGDTFIPDALVVHEPSLSYSLRYTLLPTHSSPGIIACGYHFNHTLRPIEVIESYPMFWSRVSSANRTYVSPGGLAKLRQRHNILSHRGLIDRHALHQYMLRRTAEAGIDLPPEVVLSPVVV
jgi:hypothetical protein